MQFTFYIFLGAVNRPNIISSSAIVVPTIMIYN